MAIGEVFVGAIFQVVLEKLVSGAFDGIMRKGVKRMKTDDKTIRDLERNLRLVAALLQDAEQQQHRLQTSEVYEMWVKELQDLAFDLEDILDLLATDAQLQLLQQTLDVDVDTDNHDRGSEGRNTASSQSYTTMVKNFLASNGSRVMQWFQYPGSGDLPSRIEDITRRLQESRIQGRDSLGLSDHIVKPKEMYPSRTQNSSRETTSLMSEQIIYGREEMKKEIIQMLLNHEEPSTENYDVIPIVGTGGIGKTTLVQHVYNDPQLNDHFALKAWVCVSDDKFDLSRVTRDIIISASEEKVCGSDDKFDLSRVTRDIIISASEENLTFNNLNQLQHKLAKVVKDKRFLIVLDDVWTEHCDDWNKLQTPFLHGARGSKAIVTTRKVNIARMMSKNQAIHLKILSDGDCWLLFKRHANLESDHDVIEMKNDIITKCNGLPLAAKALGGLFNMKVEKSQRQSLLQSGIWREDGKVLPVLRLSYFHLPSHLKQVFAYCSIFPKDYEFEEMEVILLWMAQGMLPENREYNMEVIGHHYFLELVSSSLFQRSPGYKRWPLDGKFYVMHDLVHDLSQWAAGDLCRCVMDTKALQRNCTRTRHLNLNTNITNGVDQCMGAHQLRTFMSQPNEYINSVNLRDFISRFASIRTLSLASHIITELPECIGDLKLLRYLHLKFPNIRALPKSIGRLCNLQTLILSECYFLYESIGLRFLVELRHVRFPESLWLAMPVGIRKLTNLQTMGDVILGDDHGRGSLIRELKNLNHLRGNLKITGLQNVRTVEDAQEAQIHQKKGLERLDLHWFRDVREDDGVDDGIKRDVLEQLKPNSYIKGCELQGYSGLTLPSWLGEPSFENMVEIRMVKCEKCEQLPPLGQLPLLKKLWLEGMKSWVGWLHDTTEKFPCLEELVIKECESFQGTLPPLLPCLKILRIKCCRQAKVSLPCCPKLEGLQIYSCEALLSSTNVLVIHCSEEMRLEKIKSGFTGLQVDGRCRKALEIQQCDSLQSIEKIPVAAQKVDIDGCGKLERVEWEEASTSSASNNNGVSIHITFCKSVVRLGNIPLIVAELEFRFCTSLEDVMFGGKWNLFKSSEATDGDSNGPPQLPLDKLVELLIWNCPKLMSLTEGVLMPSLQRLSIIKSPKMGLPPSLQELDLVEMDVTQRIQEWGLDYLTHLESLTIQHIGHSGDSIECIVGTDIDDDDGDDAILHLPSTSLCDLDIMGFKNLKTIKCSTFPNLTTLSIGGCPNFASFRDGDDCGQLQAARIQLKDLSIAYMVAKKPIQEWGLDLLTHLQSLSIECIRWAGDSVACIVGKHVTVDKEDADTALSSRSSSALYLPSTSLSRLSIEGFPVNENMIEQQSASDLIQDFNDLTSINCSTFPNLTELCIWNCPKLESLGPNNYLPPKLKDVMILESPLIEQQSTSDPNGFIRFDRFSKNRYTI